MSVNWVALGLVPLLFVVIVVVECNRLHCLRRVQRRVHDPLPLNPRDSADPDVTA